MSCEQCRFSNSEGKPLVPAVLTKNLKLKFQLFGQNLQQEEILVPFLLHSFCNKLKKVWDKKILLTTSKIRRQKSEKGCYAMRRHQFFLVPKLACHSGRNQIKIRKTVFMYNGWFLFHSPSICLPLVGQKNAQRQRGLS